MTVTATAPTSTGPTTGESGNALAKLSGDYTMFLKLLTSQMTNQDPLNPMDTAQYTQQLVQYSAVEQSIQQSATLKDILARLSSQDMIQASSLIGRTVRYDGADAALHEQAPASWQWSLARPAASLSVTVTDANGREVAVHTLDPASTSYAWDGTLANGTRAADGLYTLGVIARDSTGADITATVNGTGVVDAVSLNAGALDLSVNGVERAASGVLAIR